MWSRACVLVGIMVVGACVATSPMSLSDSVINAIELDTSSSEAEARSQFEDYLSRHNKRYEPEEREHRFRNFRESLMFVREHNADPTKKFTVGMNEFADWSQDEFGKHFLITEGLEVDSAGPADARREDVDNAQASLSLDSRAMSLSQTTAGWIGEDDDEFVGLEMGTLHKNSQRPKPAKVDWSAKSGKVYKQGICAACYTFTTNSAIKAQHANAGIALPELSDQEILSCSRDFGNHGCVGGNMEKSYHYILGKQNKGQLTTAADYPYEGRESACKADRYKTVPTRLKGYRKIRRGSEDDLQDALADTPVAVGIDAHHPAFKLYESGVFDIDYCTNKLTHAVLLTGFGTDESGAEYYQLKNSWGTGWGRKGFGRIKRGTNMCAIANLASYPIVDTAQIANDDIIHASDTMDMIAKAKDNDVDQDGEASVTLEN